MRKIFLFLLFTFSLSNAQTPLPIYSPNFSNIGGWQINGNATVISNSYLRLTPNSGNQAGSAFWKQKISLPNDMSFATYFTSKMTPGSRADGMTFCIQQASNNAGSSGGGLGYQGMPGKSIAVEYDTYDNGEVGGNNHIALDINGVLHSGSTNVVASPVNLADGAMKYNWIEYNGATNVLQVRISNTNVRPTNATLTVTVNLATNFAGISDFYFGYTAATGGATEEHAIYSALVAPNSTPLSSTGSYSQGVASITLTSSNAISCLALTSTITVTTKDINGIGIATNLVMSSDIGGGTLSAYTLTTNSSGIGTVVFTSNSGTLASNTIRAEEPNVGAYGTVIVTKTGVVPIGGSVSSNTHTSNTNTGTLTLSGYTGTITKWQKSVDNGTTWSDLAITTTTYTYTNQVDGTQFRAVISGGTCTANSTPGVVTVQFSYSGYIYNSENLPLTGIAIKLYYKLKAQTSFAFYGTFSTDISGKYTISTTLPVNSNDFRLIIDGLSINPPITSDAFGFNQKLILRSFNSRDFYRMDVNNDDNLSITDVFLIYFRRNVLSSWSNSVPNYRIFNTQQWSSINSASINLKSTYPGTQSMLVDNLISESSSNYYIVRTGYVK